MKDAVEELADNTAVPFENAQAMPRSVYLDNDFLEHELQHIFSKEWVCVGRASQFSEPGDYVTAEIAGRPIICLLYTSPSPRDKRQSRMPSSA